MPISVNRTNNSIPVAPIDSPATTVTTNTTTNTTTNRNTTPADANRLNSQFLRSRLSIGSRAMQDSLRKQLKDLPDPKLRKEHEEAKAKDPSLYQYKKVENGRLFVGGVKATDVIQGRIADCYLVASLSAIAHTDPNYIKDGIKNNGDGTYTVRLYDTDWRTGQYVAKNITVDADLPMRADGKTPLYARSTTSKSGQNELWVAILEKAIAVSRGSYAEIGEGGSAMEVLEMVTGKSARFYNTQTMSFETLKRQVNAGHPVVAATRGKEAEELYKGTNIYPWHAYTVMGTEEKDGQQFVVIRNPWGNTEPGNDGKDDGIFKLSFADFKKYYVNAYVSEA